MTLFKHTEPPKEGGQYLTNLGIMNYYKDGNYWISPNVMCPRNPEWYYSPSPPKDIEVILNRLKIVNGALGSNSEYILNNEEIETLLKLRAE